MKKQSEQKPGYNLMYLAVIIVILLIILFLVMKPRESDTGELSKEKKIELWNGNDLLNWDFYLADSTVNPDTVFIINENVIRIAGKPFGYMRTKDIYSDYKLHVEWRWPEDPGNSGVFLNINPPDAQWPLTIECQLKAGNAGDLVFLGGSDAMERTDKEKRVLPKYLDSNEKEAGAWNEYEIINSNDSIMVYVNGTFQNACSHAIPDAGHIGLQSEGAPIEFRNVYIIQTPR